MDQVVAQADDSGAGALVGGGKRGVLQLGADEQVLGGVLVKATAGEVEQLLVADVTDRGAVVAGDVVLVA